MTAVIDPPLEQKRHDDESDDDSPAPGPAREVSAVKSLLSRRNWLLLTTIGVDAAMILVLAVWDLRLTASPSAVFGSLLLLTVAISCVWAFCALLYECPTRLTATVISQVFVAILAGYVVVLDSRTPKVQWFGVTGAAVTFGLIAVFWVVRLGRYAGLQFAKSAALVVALIPVLGVYQYWMETEYIPQSSRPLIDGSVELTPIGRSGPVVHLQAKVMLENRGSFEAVVAGGLMRVTSYQTGSLDEGPEPDEVQEGINLGGTYDGADYRAESTLAAKPKLVYADDFLKVTDRLPAGGKFEYKRAINVDSRYAKLARLTVDAVFLTARGVLVGDGTCDNRELGPRLVKEPQPPDKLQYLKDGAALMCIAARFTPRNALQERLSDDPEMYTTVLLGGPAAGPKAQSQEYPTLSVAFGSKTVPNASEKAELAIPNFKIRNLVAEYSLDGPSDAAGEEVQAARSTH